MLMERIMASDAFSSKTPDRAMDVEIVDDSMSAWDTIKLILKPIASLKLTVVLFALSIVIVLIGTLAQGEKDMWRVIDDYFRAWVAWVEFRVFLPRAWFPNWQSIQGGFWFPGGALIGTLMFVNLLAAHLVRFKIQSKGSQLASGLAVIAVATGLIAMVIISGHGGEGLQGTLPFELTWGNLWSAIKWSLALTLIGSVAYAISLDASRYILRWILIGCAIVLAGISFYLFYAGQDAYIGDAGMRILWQLIQSGAGALVLLGGCAMVFKKRCGIVVIHAGVGLLMFGQWWVGKYDVEEQMTIREGQTATYAQDIRTVELAVADTSPADHDNVVVIPKSILIESTSLKDKPIHDEKLPFNVQVVEFFENADLRQLKPGEEGRATAGTGLKWDVQTLRSGSGTDMNAAVDLAAAYVKFTDKQSGKDLGTYLLSQIMSAQDFPEKVTVDGKTYNIDLRFKRSYKPYSLHLIDVRKDDYLGTNTPRNYSSTVHLMDREHNEDRTLDIWMNNPLRYSGETFYQSGYHPADRGGAESTTLSVVTNSGWMIPYVACMVVVVGMLAHFLIALMRFLSRVMGPIPQMNQAAAGPVVTAELTGDVDTAPRPKPGRKSKRPITNKPDFLSPEPPTISTEQVLGYVLPIAMVLLCMAYTAKQAQPPAVAVGAMDIYEAGKLPVIEKGRVKPLDTLARNSLRIISNRETFEDKLGDEQPAIRWLLDVISGSEDAEKHKVFRIENLEVLATLGLEKRHGFRYSVEEMRGGDAETIREFERQVELARDLSADKLNTYQRKLLELDRRIHVYTLLVASFRPLPFPDEKDFEQDPEATRMQLFQMLSASREAGQVLARMQPPLAIPVTESDNELTQKLMPNLIKDDWLPYQTAYTKAYVETQLLNQPTDAATLSWTKILDSYAKREVSTFNREVAKYQDSLERNPPKQLAARPSPIGSLVEWRFGNFYRFEAYFNHLLPFYNAAGLYMFAYSLVSLAWLGWMFGWGRPLNRAAFCVIVFTLVLHSLALLGRMYLSDRPPVTNLYSSAVYIGWLCVVFGIVLELIFRISIGNVISATAGFATLVIAHYLSGDGDTIAVMQAVLDTQFWLATHVVCITSGYAATLVAGLLGVAYILTGLFTPLLSVKVDKRNVLGHGTLRVISDLVPAKVEKWSIGTILGKMTYGVVCFAIFFSFFGTVLGGLWADDSWGRFWGWDPKENGALLIVLWNALILHARWDGMVKDRGFAVLAVGGNIVTAWSWFGVNELGIGLHSYGFTEGVLPTLGTVVAIHLAIIAIGSLPKHLWWSFKTPQSLA
jgi:cytochrome c-type biogenesis protein CcsB